MRPLLLSVLALCLLIPCVASADPTVTMRLKGGVSFGGSLDTQRRSVADEVDISVSEPVVQDLEPSFGGALEVEVAPIRYFSVGIQFGVTTWTTTSAEELDYGRDVFMDFNGVFKAMYPVIDELVIYVSLPGGLTINRFSEQNQEAAGSDWDHGVGWNLGTFLGIQWMFNESGGLFLEGGWVHREFTHTADGGSLFGTPVDLKLDGSTNQGSVSLGFAFNL